MFYNMNIGLIGLPNVGKSSFLNGLIGIPIANTSIKRETLIPERWDFSTFMTNSRNIEFIYERNIKIHEQNEILRKNMTHTLDENIDTIKLRGCLGSNILSKDFSVIDFPGLNCISDDGDKYMQIFKKNLSKCNVILYITHSERAFTEGSEMKYFQQIIIRFP